MSSIGLLTNVVIPQVVTAIQSTVGMSVWWYSIAVVASLPKQLAVVYLGVIFGQTDAVISPENERVS